MARLAAFRTSEWNTEPELFCLEVCFFFFCWRNNPYIIHDGQLNFPCRHLLLVTFSAQKFHENSKKTQYIVNVEVLVPCNPKFVFECALIHETHQRALSKGFRKRTWRPSELPGISSEGGEGMLGLLSPSKLFFGCPISWPGPSLRGDGNWSALLSGMAAIFGSWEGIR